MKTQITSLKQSITEAKTKQDEATKEAKRIEKDMSDFNDNKDDKLTELQSSLDKLKKQLSKNSAAIKPLQQEVRDAMLEAEQCGSDLSAAQESLEDADVNLKTVREEMAALEEEWTAVKVSPYPFPTPPIARSHIHTHILTTPPLPNSAPTTSPKPT